MYKNKTRLQKATLLLW